MTNLHEWTTRYKAKMLRIDNEYEHEWNLGDVPAQTHKQEKKKWDKEEAENVYKQSRKTI